MPWNNFPHLAARAFNQPLLLEPTYARVFFSALSDRFGTGRLIDTASGEVMNSDGNERARDGVGQQRANTPEI
ncbi:hypothetical protein ABCG81_26130, partial [Escherichia coli]